MMNACRVAGLRSAMALCGVMLAGQAHPQESAEKFTYYPPGEMTHRSEQGVKDRRVYFPAIKFPIRVGPEAGADGSPLRAYPNSQLFRPQGYEVNDTRLFAYPWSDTLCESNHNGGPMPVCPRGRSHQGVDIRPDRPRDQTYDVIAMADGKVESVTPFTYVRIRFAEDDGTSCEYEHLKPILVRAGQNVRKGDVIGQVSNIMGGGPGTSIHLHFQCEATHPDLQRKVKMPVYTSLIVAYRREWGMTESVEAGALLRDPERELDIGQGARPVAADPTCSEPLADPLPGTRSLSIIARYVHNCSEMGLLADGAARKLVYVRPKLSLRQAAERQPVLITGTLKEGVLEGDAVSYNADCHDPKFKVSGPFADKPESFTLYGDRQRLDSSCNPIEPRHEQLRFVNVDVAKPQPPVPDPAPVANGPNCPFALPPGQKPLVVDGKEIPPKSERSCNFTAITLPGNMSFSDMPRYVREWPGVRTDVLRDKFEDQIITFRSAETGVGAWWYWLTHRAINGPQLDQKGFGASGTPSLAQIARSIAGRERSEDFVRRTYLAPYLNYAEQYFGRMVGENERLNLRDNDVRWNVARIMFRLESGRAPVISAKQFACGVTLGADVAADFDRANVEGGDSIPIRTTAFKGLEFYIKQCTGSGGPVIAEPGSEPPGSAAGGACSTAEAAVGWQRERLQLLSTVDSLKSRIAELTAQRRTATARTAIARPQTRILSRNWYR